MTIQDVNSWVQTGLQLLIGGGVVWAFIWLGGMVKRGFESQEKTIAAHAEQMKALKTTIDAQAEQMKGQSLLLQDVERHSKIMQQVIDFVDAPAMLQRMQAYRDLVEIERQELTTQLQEEATGTRQAVEMIGKLYVVVAYALRLIPPDQHRTLIDGLNLPPHMAQGLTRMADAAPHLPGEVAAQSGASTDTAEGPGAPRDG